MRLVVVLLMFSVGLILIASVFGEEQWALIKKNGPSYPHRVELIHLLCDERRDPPSIDLSPMGVSTAGLSAFLPVDVAIPETFFNTFPTLLTSPFISYAKSLPQYVQMRDKSASEIVV